MMSLATILFCLLSLYAEGADTSANNATRLRRRLQGVTASELAAANSPDKCWLQINGNAYDVTAYGPSHPPGPASIFAQCGTDATAKFNAQVSHSAGLLALVTNLGAVSADAPPPVPSPTAPPTNAPPMATPTPPPTNLPPMATPTPPPTNLPPMATPTPPPVPAVAAPATPPPTITIARPTAPAPAMTPSTVQGPSGSSFNTPPVVMPSVPAIPTSPAFQPYSEDDSSDDSSSGKKGGGMMGSSNSKLGKKGKKGKKGIETATRYYTNRGSGGDGTSPGPQTVSSLDWLFGP